MRTPIGQWLFCSLLSNSLLMITLGQNTALIQKSEYLKQGINPNSQLDWESIFPLLQFWARLGGSSWPEGQCSQRGQQGDNQVLTGAGLTLSWGQMFGVDAFSSGLLELPAGYTYYDVGQAHFLKLAAADLLLYSCSWVLWTSSRSSLGQVSEHLQVAVFYFWLHETLLYLQSQ